MKEEKFSTSCADGAAEARRGLDKGMGPVEDGWRARTMREMGQKAGEEEG